MHLHLWLFSCSDIKIVAYQNLVGTPVYGGHNLPHLVRIAMKTFWANRKRCHWSDLRKIFYTFSGPMDCLGNNCLTIF